MRRIASLLLVFVLVAGCAGCGAKNGDKEEETKEKAAQSEEVKKEAGKADKKAEPQDDDFTLTFFTDPESDEFQTCGEVQETFPGDADAGEQQKIRFVCDSDDVALSLEVGEWVQVGMTDYFHSLDYIFSVETTKDAVYEFPGVLYPEFPMYRITAFKGNKSAVWYLKEDEGNGGTVCEVTGEELQPALPQETDPIITLCGVYAGMTVTAGSDVGQHPEYFWKTVTNAITLLTLLVADTDENGYIYTDEWLLDAYVETLFPDTAVYPEVKEGEEVIGPGEWGDYYTIRANYLYDYSSLERLDEELQDEGAVITMIVKGQIDESVQVYLEPVSKLRNPFGWMIVGAEISKG